MTVLRFSGGQVIEVNLSLAEVRDLIQEALVGVRLLELEAPDGNIVVINPQQVQFFQDADADGATYASHHAGVREPA